MERQLEKLLNLNHDMDVMEMIMAEDQLPVSTFGIPCQGVGYVYALFRD